MPVSRCFLDDNRSASGVKSSGWRRNFRLPGISAIRGPRNVNSARSGILVAGAGQTFYLVRRATPTWCSLLSPDGSPARPANLGTELIFTRILFTGTTDALFFWIPASFPA